MSPAVSASPLIEVREKDCIFGCCWGEVSCCIQTDFGKGNRALCIAMCSQLRAGEAHALGECVCVFLWLKEGEKREGRKQPCPERVYCSNSSCFKAPWLSLVPKEGLEGGWDRRWWCWTPQSWNYRREGVPILCTIPVPSMKSPHRPQKSLSKDPGME